MRAIGIILAGGSSSKMKELTNKRAISAMPIAGSYRAIDFALSSMANSNIQKVAVLTQFNSRSLNEHLSSSKWWDFGRKQGGLFVFTPTITNDNGFWYRGTADAIAQNLTFLKSSHEPYVVIASGDGVYKLNYNKVLEYHINKKADITIVTTTLDEGQDATRFGVVSVDDNGRIVDFEEKVKAVTKIVGIKIGCLLRLVNGREIFFFPDELALFCISSVHKSVNSVLNILGRFKLLKALPCVFKVDLACSVPSVGFMSDADLTAKKIVLVPVAKTERADYFHIKCTSKLCEHSVIKRVVIAWKSRARGLTYFAKITSIVPTHIVK